MEELQVFIQNPTVYTGILALLAVLCAGRSLLKKKPSKSGPAPLIELDGQNETPASKRGHNISRRLFGWVKKTPHVPK